MATTFADVLAGAGDRVRWKLYFTIDGVPIVFGMDAVDTAAFEAETGRVHRACIRGMPEIPGMELSYDTRMVVGGTFSAELLDRDGALEAFFVPRKRRATWCTTDHTAATTTLTVADSSAVGSLPCDLWVDGETMRATAAPTATTLTVVRAKYGSPAQKHRGATENGASVFTAPRRWKGRRVRVWAYLQDSQGRVTTDRRVQMGVWRLRGAPVREGPGQWSIDADPLLDDFATRKLGDGIVDARALFLDSGASTAIVDPPTFSNISTRFSYAIFRFDGDAFDVRPVAVDVDGVYTTLSLGEESRAVGGQRPTSTRAWTPRSARHICILDGGDPAVLLLFALCSRLGDGANGAYDVLPGIEPAGFGASGYRMGAGIDEDDVDIEAIRAAIHSAPRHILAIDDSIPAGDLLADYALITGTVVAITRDGKLTLIPLAESVVDSVLTIGDSDLKGAVKVAYDDAGVAPRLRLRANYNPITQNHEATVEVVDLELVAEADGDEGVLEVESRLLQMAPAGIGSDGGVLFDRVTREEIEPILRRFQVASGRGRLLLSFVCSHRAMTLFPGDVVTVGFSAPDLEGGDVSGSVARVVRWQPRLTDDGGVEVTLEVLSRLSVVAPAAVISSWTLGTLTLVLQSGLPEDDGGTSPTDNFYVGQELLLFDVSAGGAPDFVYVASIVDGVTMTLTAAPGSITPAAGDVLTSTSGGWTVSPQTANAAGFTEDDYLYQQSAAGLAFSTRWR